MRILIALLLCAAPASAQIVSTHPPLSPEQAVAVLRGSHSIADYTDRHFASDDGPTFFILGGSPTAGPYGELRPFGPDRRLDGTSYADAPWEQFAYVGRSYGPRYNRAPHARPASTRTRGRSR